jgi:nucleoside-diphosphate-sugar epimerase
VTGGAGFIGANLVRGLLAEGARVSVLVRPTTHLWRLEELRSRISLLEVEFLNSRELDGALNRTRPDFVFHLAFPSGHAVDPQSRRAMLEDGVLATAALLEALSHFGIRQLIHFGSSMEYGPRRRARREAERLEPVAFRGAAKAACSLLCLQFAREHRTPVVVLRPFHVYGYWESPARLIPAALLAAIHGSALPLTERGIRRDFVFVEDIVEAALKACRVTIPPGGAINLGSGRQWTNEAVIKLVEAVTGQGVRTDVGAYPTRPWDSAYLAADTRPARKHLGWSPRHSLRQGLEKTYMWLCANLDKYSPFLGA